MVCRKCRTALPDGSKYCLSCGAKQDITRRPRSRGNGTGSVYQLPSKTWIAVRICGWYTAEDGSVRRKTRSKSGFRTKKEALEYPSLSRRWWFSRRLPAPPAGAVRAPIALAPF